MAEYIDREALLEKMKKSYCGTCNNYNEILCRSCLMDDALNDIEYAPTADVVEVNHGEWKCQINWFWKRLHCSCCNSEGDWPSPYCPFCGAKMDGERRNDNGM